MFVAPMDAIGWGSHTPASGDFTIPNSIWLDGSADFLTWTPGSAATSRRIQTWSWWQKLSLISKSSGWTMVMGNATSGYFGFYQNPGDHYFSFTDIGGSTVYFVTSNRVFRDPTAWMHLCVGIDTTQGSIGDRFVLEVNGVAHTSWSSNTLTQDTDLDFGDNGEALYLGSQSSSPSNVFDGYLAQFAFVDGTKYNASKFTETNDAGILIPKDVSSEAITWGTNGFLLEFKETGSSQNASGIGADTSGRNNHWAVGGGAIQNNQVTDSPSNDSLNNIGNYATFNSAIAQSTRNTNTIADGNLHWSGGGGDGISATHSFGTSGKWYWEQTAGDADSYVIHGIISKSVYNSNDMTENSSASGFDTVGGDGEAFGWYRGNKWEKTSTASYGSATSAADDVVMLALDIDNDKIWYGVNGTWISSGNPATGANASSTITSGIEWYPWAGSFTGDPIVNFGQKAFSHTIPTGFSALATQNMTAPAITLPSTYFDVVTYTGTGSELAISSLSFQPDMVWIKNRDQTDNNMLYDVVRGATKEVHTNSNVGETTTAQTLKSFDSAGFTLGTDVEVNTNTEDYVAWCWKAGGSASTVSDGMVKESDSSETSISRSVSTDAGLSIVTYTGNGADSNIKHGLGAKPKFIHICYRAGTTNWLSYHEDANATEGRYFMNLNDAAIAFDNGASGYFQGTAPTTSLFYLNNSSYNTSGYTYVAYLWSEIDGFSRFGSYIGNGNAVGPHIYLGFEPALLIVKKATSATNNWNMLDHKRHPVNDGDAPYIYADTTAAETNPGDSSQDVDILANGFKIRNSNAGYNTSSATYVYAAWAKTPYALNNRAR